MSDPSQLFTLQSFATLQGGAFAAILVPSTIDKYLLQLERKWLVGSAFFISEIASFTAAVLSTGGSAKWIIAVLNGFLIFSAAMGQNQGAYAIGAGQDPTKPAQGATGTESLSTANETRRFKILRSWV